MYNVRNTFIKRSRGYGLKSQTIKGSGSYPRGFVYLPRRAATAARDKQKRYLAFFCQDSPEPSYFDKTKKIPKSLINC